MTFADLYTDLLRSAANNDMAAQLAALRKDKGNTRGIDCLLHPEKHAAVWHVDPCDCAGEEAACAGRCIYNAITRGSDGHLIIDQERCVGCEECIRACQSGRLTASRDILPVLDAIKNAGGPVYAMVAPAVAGQYGRATIGKLRSACKKLGFTGLVEVALFADILTLREALVFDRNIKHDTDFMLTSCCCPIWIAMVRRGFSQYLDKLPDSVSPMVASGRALKRLNPSAVTVFIGPCMAKKVEAREKDVAGAVDFVLTFEELGDIFKAFGIEPEKQEEDGRAHASAAGRIYGRTGGVSQAVRETVRQLNPGRTIDVRATQADGTKSCRALLDMLSAGEAPANFLEGMGCEGGCAGGPKGLIDPAIGRKAVEAYAADAAFKTPLDNPAVMEMLRRLGYDTVESLLAEDSIFTRHFEDTRVKS